MSRHRSPSIQTRAVLELLANDPSQWRHGYHLSQETGISSGTLYPLLMRLAERGFLESRWEQATAAGRPPRHLYRLTTTGSQYAAETVVKTRRRSAPRALPGSA